MNLSSNSADKDVGVTLQALPTREGIMMGLLLFKPGNAVIEEIKTTEEAREFFAKQFPQFLPHIDSAELERFAERPVSKLPVRRPSPPPPRLGFLLKEKSLVGWKFLAESWPNAAPAA